MRIYLSGPITGKSRAEIDASFFRKAAELENTCNEVYNPAQISCAGLRWETYMNVAVAILSSGDLDAIYMLKGWEKSEGARVEHAITRGAGLEIIYEEGGVEELTEEEMEALLEDCIEIQDLIEDGDSK